MAVAAVGFQGVVPLEDTISNSVCHILRLSSLVQMSRLDAIGRMPAWHSRVVDLHAWSWEPAVGVNPCQHVTTIDLLAKPTDLA
jgi:hypothetical protein